MKNILKASLLSSVFALSACGKQEQPTGTEAVLDNGTKITVPTGIHSGFTLGRYDDPNINSQDMAKGVCEMIYSARNYSTSEPCVMSVIDRRHSQITREAHRFNCTQENASGILSPVCRPK